ncbi:hypothetical protein BCR43DRAFT_15859 [Syncephalastrum racemosum]|uniref:CHAT domain-containing protein n=1 Tax=Syncephalastrum racemosum TaxID=13706 RepID=A0A1X2HSS2_SYNRA|nr:hypothetical protein BCR43DRAFT_15859 [Syncephalastrum racemosum]
MGCSSGKLKSQGEFDPTGPAIDYLMNGSPAVVANLWDVTDVSIDSLAQEMLNGWGLLKDGQTSTSLVEAVAAARNACRRLRYLIGAAAVVYGVPVYIQN